MVTYWLQWRGPLAAHTLTDSLQVDQSEAGIEERHQSNCCAIHFYSTQLVLLLRVRWTSQQRMSFSKK